MTENRGHSGGRARTRSAAVRYQAVCSPVQNDPNGSRESVLSLAARCNALGLSPLHFRDVVLDSINT